MAIVVRAATCYNSGMISSMSAQDVRQLTDGPVTEEDYIEENGMAALDRGAEVEDVAKEGIGSTEFQNKASLGELAKVCDIDATSPSRALRPLIANGWVKYGRGSLGSFQTCIRSHQKKCPYRARVD